MAVYEQTYRPFAGPLTPAWSRFLTLPRHAFQDIFSSKLFTGFFCFCFAPALVSAILIYLHYNISALAILKISIENLIAIDADFFRSLVGIQGMFGFLLTLLVGPSLISRDTSNNALPLYLCRPLSRTEYVVGKMSILVILLSAITWIPDLLLFLFQSYLKGGAWMRANLFIGGAIFLSSWTWILTITLLCLAISAWVKWRMAASAALFGVFFIPAVLGNMINELFDTRFGDFLNVGALLEIVSSALFKISMIREEARIVVRQGGTITRQVEEIVVSPPLWGALVALGVIAAICVFLIARKIRAYEVVR